MPTFIQASNAIQPTPMVCGTCRVPGKVFGHRPQGLDAWQLIYATEGEAKIIFPGGQRVLAAGDLVLFAPGVMQHYGSPGPRASRHLFFIFHVGPGWQQWMDWPELSPGIGFLRPKKEAPAIFRTLRQAVELSRGLHRFRRELALDLVHQALIRCYADYHSRGAPQIDPRLAKWIERVSQDIKKSHLPIRDMAEEVGMSPSQLARAFHRQLGLAPARYFEKLRMDQGAALLGATTMRVREIAETMGYDDPLYFSTRFREAMGMSPRAYRRKIELERIAGRQSLAAGSR